MLEHRLHISHKPSYPSHDNSDEFNPALAPVLYFAERIKIVIPMILAVISAFSCRKADPIVPDDDGRQKVIWKAVSVQTYATKALVENREMMERSCTPEGEQYTYADGTTQNGLGQTVGVWADYRIGTNGNYTEVKDVFKGTRLQYDPSGTDTATKWDYKANPAYWVIGGQYAFRAYYPAGELNINEKLSSAKSLVIEMNTAKTQRDVLVAYNSYDTKTGLPLEVTEGDPKTLEDPVVLNFRHAMTALRFRFKFVDSDDSGVFYAEDELTSCWFQSDKDNSFALTGYLIYGDGESYAVEGLTNWRYQYYPVPGVIYYRWRPQTGIPFWNRNNGTTFEKSTDQRIATAFTQNSSAETPVYGSELVKHDGWLSVIPQPSTGNVRLYFTTKAGGDNTAFSVLIPQETGTAWEIFEKWPDNPEYQKDPAHRIDEDGNPILLDDFVPGFRYTYTIAISKTDSEITLSIEPWNRLDSSFDIRFN